MQIYRSYYWRLGNLMLVSLLAGSSLDLAPGLWELVTALGQIVTTFPELSPEFQRVSQWVPFLGLMGCHLWFIYAYAQTVADYGWWFGYWQKFRLFVRLSLTTPLMGLVGMALGVAGLRLVMGFLAYLGVMEGEAGDIALALVALLGFFLGSRYGCDRCSEERERYRTFSGRISEVNQHHDQSFKRREEPWDKFVGQLHRWLCSWVRRRLAGR